MSPDMTSSISLHTKISFLQYRDRIFLIERNPRNSMKFLMIIKLIFIRIAAQ